jgi:methyltransferase (TIGR00027 family)
MTPRRNTAALREAERVLSAVDWVMADSVIPEGVGRTALGMARVRAEESARPDRLFDDPFAAAFAAAAPEALPADRPASDPAASLGWLLQFYGVIRTRFFDDYLLAACADGISQMVLLAAGLDSRAFRLAWPAPVRVFEVDMPQVLSFKDRVLDGQSPTCERVVLPADLRGNWTPQLIEAGFDPQAPTVWLIEGLFVYLTAGEAAGLLDAVGSISAAGSSLAFEHSVMTDNPTMDRARNSPLSYVVAHWKGGIGADAPDWLERHGWTTQIHDRVAAAAGYGRSAPDQSVGGFLTAFRR